VENESEIDEQTRVSLPVSSWYQVIIVIGTVLFCYFSLKAELGSTTMQTNKNAQDLANLQEQFFDLKLELISISSDLKFLRNSVEKKR